MPRKDKELEVKELSGKLEKNNGVILTDYQGLTVAEISELRSKLRAINCDYKVVKNTLTKLAMQARGIEGFTEHLEGPTAIAIQNGDPVASAKIIIDFSKEHAKLKLKAGMLGKKLLSINEIKSLAALPSREVLIAKVLGTIKAPLYNLVGVLQGPIRNLVYVLDAVKKQKTQ